MATILNFNECKITTEDDCITCNYPGVFFTKRWRIDLTDKEIFYVEKGKKPLSFKVADIKELQFEMIDVAYRYAGLSTCCAFVVMKNDDNPLRFFNITIREKYTLLNRTKAHEFCMEILNLISNKYQIPFNYKISVDTKEKQNTATVFVPIIIFVILFIMWLFL